MLRNQGERVCAAGHATEPAVAAEQHRPCSGRNQRRRRADRGARKRVAVTGRARRVGPQRPIRASRPTVIAGATGLAVAVLTASASALPAGCTQSGTTVSCPFVSTGSEQQIVVPAGVFGVDVTAVGAKGGAGATTGGTGGTGGSGAAVTAQFAVTPCITAGARALAGRRSL